MVISPSYINYAPLNVLINMSVSSGLVPWQWKQASIRPIPKIPVPSGHADFRPISITPVLTRLVEKTVVCTFLYPAFLKPPPSLSFQDQLILKTTKLYSCNFVIRMLYKHSY